MPETQNTSFGPTLLNSDQILGGGGGVSVPVSATYTGNEGSVLSAPVISNYTYAQVFRNGLLQASGSTGDYTADFQSATLSFTRPLATSESVTAIVYSGGSSSPGPGPGPSGSIYPETSVYYPESGGTAIPASILSGHEYADVYRNGIFQASGSGADYEADFESGVLSFSDPFTTSESVTVRVYDGGSTASSATRSEESAPKRAVAGPDSSAAPVYSAGSGIQIGSDNVIAANVDHSTIRVSGGQLYAPFYESSKAKGPGGLILDRASGGSGVILANGVVSVVLSPDNIYLCSGATSSPVFVSSTGGER